MIARVGVALYLLCCASLADAQAGRTLVVVLTECTGAEERSELLELLRLELRTDVAIELAEDPASARERESLWVVQDCSPAGRAHAALRYLDPQADVDATREVSLSGVERSLRPRVIALALAELLRPRPDALDRPAAREDEAEDAPEREREPEESAGKSPAVSEPESAPERTTSSSPRAPRLAWAVTLGPALQVSLASGTTSFGVEAAAAWRRLSFGVLGTLGASRDLLGDASYQRLHAFAAYAVLGAEFGAFSFVAGPRVAMGATFASATPAQAATGENTFDATSSLSVEAAIALRLGANWLARLRTDLGYAFGPRFRADARTLADFSGTYAGASLSIGFALGSER